MRVRPQWPDVRKGILCKPVGSTLGPINISAFLVIHSVPILTQLEKYIHYGETSWNTIGINGN